MVDEGYAPPVKRPIKVLGQAAQGMINTEILNMLSGKFVTEHDGFLAKRIAYVISGGDVRDNSEIEEDVILKLEKEAFVDFLKEEKTVARIEYMLKTGKPLRN
jgi:3-hydroxyacyl-CoA dehydrogenase